MPGGSGGPAGGEATSAIAARANQLIERGLTEVRRAAAEQRDAAIARPRLVAAQSRSVEKLVRP